MIFIIFRVARSAEIGLFVIFECMILHTPFRMFSCCPHVGYLCIPFLFIGSGH